MHSVRSDKKKTTDREVGLDRLGDGLCLELFRGTDAGGGEREERGERKSTHDAKTKTEENLG